MFCSAAEGSRCKFDKIQPPWNEVVTTIPDENKSGNMMMFCFPFRADRPKPYQSRNVKKAIRLADVVGTWSSPAEVNCVLLVGDHVAVANEPARGHCLTGVG